MLKPKVYYKPPPHTIGIAKDDYKRYLVFRTDENGDFIAWFQFTTWKLFTFEQYGNLKKKISSIIFSIRLWLAYLCAPQLKKELQSLKDWKRFHKDDRYHFRQRYEKDARGMGRAISKCQKDRRELLGLVRRIYIGRKDPSFYVKLPEMNDHVRKLIQNARQKNS